MPGERGEDPPAPWVTGNNPDSTLMVSGAGRRLTRRSFTARAERRVKECGSRG